MRGKARGFTLLELMVVVGVIGIASALAVGLAGDIAKRSRMEEVARELYDAFNLARSAAIKDGRTVKVYVAANKFTTFFDANNDHLPGVGESVLHEFSFAADKYRDISVDATALTVSNGVTEPTAIFSFEGFCVDEFLEPNMAGRVRFTDATMPGQEYFVEFTVAGAVWIDKP